MHYKNGREAKEGDQVVYRSYSGVKAGVVVAIAEGVTCNLYVQDVISPQCTTASEALHADDVMPPTATPAS